MSLANLEYVFGHVDNIDCMAGKAAYRNYHNLLRQLSDLYGFGFVQTVAAFAALSPNNDYMGNLRSTVSLMQGIKSNKLPEDITISTYRACGERAYNYLIGEKDFLVSTKGKKTINFYRNILHPDDAKWVTIDGHMYGMWVGCPIVMKEVAHIKIPYETIASAVKTLAKRNSLLPNQMQATLWFVWKRMNNIVFERQLPLLNNDPWKLALDVSTIKPF
jgi:hypothetical protein